MNALDFTFHHSGVSVPNMEEAIDWYDHVLGFKLDQRGYIEEARSEVAFLRKGALRIELFQTENAAPLPEERRDPRTDVRTHGNKHVAFAIAELDAFLKEVRARGADVAMEMRSELGEACYLRDCAGNLIEFLVQPADR